MWELEFGRVNVIQSKGRGVTEISLSVTEVVLLFLRNIASGVSPGSILTLK